MAKEKKPVHRVQECIMFNSRIDITNPNTICPACLEDVLDYLKSQTGR